MKNESLIAALVAAGLLAPGIAAADCFAQPHAWSARLGAHNVDPTGGTSQTAAGGVEVQSKVGVTFNIDYRVCPNLTIDLLAALPFTHGIKVNGDRVASTKHLPPVLSLQYHFKPDARFDPYVGVGVNRTLFFSESLAGGGHLQLSNTWGVAAQIGADWHFTPAWFAGIDVRYMQIEPDASVNGTPIGKVKINPIAYGANIGYRF